MRIHSLLLALVCLLLPIAAGAGPLPPKAPPFIINSGTTYQEGVFFGPRAGQGAPATIQYGTVGFGPDSLRTVTNPLAEAACFGAFSCEFLTTATGNTGLGEHTIGFGNSSFATAVGQDVMRDTFNMTSSTGVGSAALRDGVSNGSNDAFGSQAMQGNAGSILFSGTFTAGDVLRITISTTGAQTIQENTPSVVALPVSFSHTITSGEIANNIAQDFINLINNANISAVLPDGNTAYVESGVSVYGELSGTITGLVVLRFPGSQTFGWNIVPSFTCVSGTCGEAATINDGFSGIDNVAIGAHAMVGNSLTTASYNVAVGFNAMLTSQGAASEDVCIGYQACLNLTVDHNDTFMGYLAGQNAVNTQYDTAIGDESGRGITSGQNDVILGAQPLAYSCITSGSLNTEIGTDACVPSPTTGNQLSLDNIIYGLTLSGRNGTISTGQIGIATKAPNATFTVGDGGGTSVQGAHIGVLQTTAPVLTSCGTAPTLSTTGSDVHGTITEGTTATGCVLTFNKAFATKPDCVIASPGGQTLTSYSVTTTAITLVNASASGDTFTYACLQ